MIWNHKVKTATLRQLVDRMERQAEYIEQRMEALRIAPDSRRAAFLMAKVCIDKDKEGLVSLPAPLS